MSRHLQFRRLSACVAIAIVTGVVWLLRTGNDGATFHGDGIQHWLSELDLPKSDQSRQRALIAVASITSNAPSSLLAELFAKDGQLKRKLINQLEKQGFIPLKIATAGRRSEHAMNAFRHLRRKLSPAVPLLTEALDSENSLVRSRALQALGCVGAAAGNALPAIGSVLLSDPDLSVRKNAAEAIGGMKRNATPALPLFSQLLNRASADTELQLEILRAIGDIGATAEPLIPDLLNCLASGDPAIQQEALSAFERFGRSARPVIPAIMTFLTSTNPSVADSASGTLEELSGMLDPEQTEQLIEWLGSRDHRLDEAIFGILRNAHKIPDRVAPQLMDYWKLSVDDEGSSQRAQRLMERIGSRSDSSVGQLLFQEAKSSTSPIRWQVIASMGRTGFQNEEAVELVKELLESETNSSKKLVAAETLGAMEPGSLPASDFLIQAYRNGNSTTREEVSKRLDLIDRLGAFIEPAESVHTLLVDIVGGNDLPILRAQAAYALGRLGLVSPAIVHALASSLKEPHTQIHDSALGALSRLRAEPSTVVPILIEHLRTDPECRPDTARALGSYGRAANDAVPLLLDLLDEASKGEGDYAVVMTPQRFGSLSPAVEVKFNCAIALGEIGTHADIVVPRLISLLGDSDRNVRDRAAIGLGWFGSEARGAIPELERLEISEDSGPWNEARIALLMIKPTNADTLAELLGMVERYGDEDNAGLYATEALGRLGRDARDALPFLKELARSRDAGLRVRADEAINRIETDQVVE